MLWELQQIPRLTLGPLDSLVHRLRAVPRLVGCMRLLSDVISHNRGLLDPTPGGDTVPTNDIMTLRISQCVREGKKREGKLEVICLHRLGPLVDETLSQAIFGVQKNYVTSN